ncbi:PREDICTED: protein slowmo-like [Priapulus caudatus]|uniref:Protein slowmo-like n=1 Tax=Priapulus caudatus TaxID=37621 RepID=A0ABM1E8I6_PRICU|nr:PREDICTED: protein slowmo-like [Priapulus caudatus]
MKLYSSEHIFSHPWETVAKAAWRKYPNPINPAVVALDVLDRKVENGVLKTQRLISSSWSLPGWVATLLGTDQTCYVCEFSEVDPSKRTLTLKSRNLTLCNLVSVDERLSYSPHPDDSSRTLLKQEAEITIKGLPLTSYLEGVVVDTMSSKATQVRQSALDWVIGRINNEVHELTVAAERGR